MKHDESIEQIDASNVRVSLHAVRMTPTPAQCELMARHAGMVLDANTRINLTRITSHGAVLALHIVDSLAFLAHIEPLTGRVVDIGSGAGYPGIPLSIMGHELLLCESVKKKAAFLEQCVADLGIDAKVCAVRAEELALSAPACADVVIARAVSSLASLVELAWPLLRPGGRLVALKGTPTASELTQASIAARLCGMWAAASAPYSLPSGEERTVVVFERRGAAALALPRRPGMAQREPLGT